MNDFDDIVNAAIAHRADAAPSQRPEFGAVLAERQQRLRRRTAVGAGALVLAGVVGIAAFAATGERTPSGPADGGSAPDTEVFEQATVSGANWYCEGRVDVPGEAPTVVTTVVETTSPSQPPAVVETTSPSGPDSATSTVPPQDWNVGFFTTCSPLDRSAGGATWTTDVVAPTTITEATTLVVEGSPLYVVQAGDYPALVAEHFCVSLDDILVANGWTDSTTFPFPGETMAIPAGACWPYTIQPGDIPDEVAARMCVSVEALNEANVTNDAYGEFAPGSVIELPSPGCAGAPTTPATTAPG